MNPDINISLKEIYVDGINASLRAEGLKKMFLSKKALAGKEIRIPILKGVSLAVKSGEKIGIIGRNGSGKSSLLKVIAGIYPPKSGEVSINGKIAPLIEMGVGFEPELTGRQNIKVGLLYSGRLGEYSGEMEKEIIAFSGIAEKIDIPYKYYSSGMQARLAFSLCIFQRPDILLLDEVFATGDSEFVKKSEHLMKEMFSSVPISILVSHSTSIIKDLCSRCILMSDGKIIDDGVTDKIIKIYNGGAV